MQATLKNHFHARKQECTVMAVSDSYRAKDAGFPMAGRPAWTGPIFLEDRPTARIHDCISDAMSRGAGYDSFSTTVYLVLCLGVLDMTTFHT